MSRSSVVIALLAVVLIVDNVLIALLLRRGAALEESVRQTQTKVAQYITSTDPTVVGTGGQRPSNRLAYEGQLAAFLAASVVLSNAGDALSNPQRADAARLFATLGPQMAALDAIDRELAEKAMRLHGLLSERQQDYLEEHREEVGRKRMEIVLGPRRNDSVTKAFQRYFDTAAVSPR